MTVKNNSTLETDLLGSLIGENIIGERYFKSVFTPANVVKDMIDLLDKDESYFESPGILDRKFLDIQCKSGRFLVEIMNRLLKSNQFNFEFNKAIRNGSIDATEYEASELGKREFIIDRCLYAICPDFMTSMVVSRNLAGDAFRFDNAAVVDSDGDNKVPTAAQSFKALREMLKSKGEENMTFDVVVGNPPYNDGMDIDFVFGAFEISKDYVLMITPAKWQTAEADPKCKSKHNYADFRGTIVPYVSHVCFYPDSFDVFLAAIAEGVSYYLINKRAKTDKCCVENKCAIQNKLNSTEYRSLTTGKSLWNSGQRVIDYLGDYRRLSIEGLGNNRKYRVSVNKQLSVGGGGYAAKQQNSEGRWVLKPDIIGKGGPLLSTDGNTYALGKSAVVEYGKAGVSGTSFDAFSSDSKDECESFKSYIETKMIRFLLLTLSFGLSSMGNTKLWEKVPAPTVLDADGNRVPGKFDHIYTDEELYKTFNLPQEYIDVIEAVIKERKV